MPSYHADAEQELMDILQQGSRSVKRCLGMMLQRHLRMDNGTEPLDASEFVNAGSGTSDVYQVAYSYNLFALVDCVYGKVGADVTVLAADGNQGLVRLGLPPSAPDALARSWGRST
ncbi:MAG: hypothetical protein KA207_10950 [Burkholderiaceae bacterium]|nr:hypothetical protein [Burkholderiaceae bacterium]